MAWKPQSEDTFRDRIVRINRAETRRSRKRGGGLKLILRLCVIVGLFVLCTKTFVQSNVSEAAYRQAALELRQNGPSGVALATIFGPDPVSTELARRLKL